MSGEDQEIVFVPNDETSDVPHGHITEPSSEHAVALKDAEARTVTLAAELKTAKDSVVELSAKLRATTDRAAALDAEVVALRADVARRDEIDLRSDIGIAYETYKDLKRLTDADVAPGGWVTKLARSDKKAFREAFPPIDLSNRHLLRQIVPPEPAHGSTSAEPPTVTTVARRLMSEKGLSYTLAMNEASRICQQQDGGRK